MSTRARVLRTGDDDAPVRPDLNPPAPLEGERAVLVTTAHRGVFFGYCRDTSRAILSLRRGRNCLYWSSATKGFVGLANPGPDAACRIGPPADMELRDITSVLAVTSQAADRWEAAPWS